MTVEWRSWCRLCAGSKDVNVSLRDENDKDVSDDVIQKANKYLLLDISTKGEDYDRFPQQVCNNCVKYLQQIDTYAVQCARVQDMFYNLSLDSGGDKIYLIRHRFLNNVKEEMVDVEQTDENHDYQIPCSFEVKSYETVPSSDHDKSKVKSWKGVCKITEGSGIPRRGRPRKRDKIVPRIKLRAIRPPTRSKIVQQDLDKEDNIEESSELCVSQKQLVGAARRKAKLPKNVQTDVINSESDAGITNLKDIKHADINDKEEASDDITSKKLKKAELKVLVPSLFHFKCHICENVSKNWNALRNHCKDIHGKAAQITCECGNVLSTRTAILEHLARHTHTNLYSCDQCKKTFHRKSLLNIHVVSHLPKEEQPYVCCKCARRFHCEALLRNHERTHLPKEERLMFPCEICNKMFTSKSSVSAHLKAVHHGERPFVCEQCGHSFTSKGILQEHLTVHSDEVPWNCSKCSKSFKTKYRLKIHMDTHRETPYQCPKCPVQLSTQRTLRMHLVIHRDTKAYQCPTCGKAFRRAKDLKNHSNLHTGKRPYTCPFCSRTFANGSNCRSHKLRMHREELKAHESSSQSAESCHLASTATTVSYENSSTTDPQIVKKEDCILSNVPSGCTSEIRKTDFPVSQTSSTDTSFSSFLAAVDRRYQPQGKQLNSLRTSLSQHFALDHQYYSPCQEQDISSSTVPAFPGIPYVHHQPVVFNRTLEPS